MSKLTLICSDWRPLKKNTLLGFARIHIGELDLTIHDVAVHEKADRRWAALPARPWIKGGAVVTGDAGKIQYSPLLEFGRRARRVLERRHPRRQRALPGRPGARSGGRDMTLAEWFKAAQAADIAETAERICRPLRRSRTGQLKGQCIVHGGPDTLVVDVKKRIWKCLGRDESGGGAVSFVHYQFQLSHRETLAILLGLKRDGRAT